jgi:glycerol-3-phosphate dehydrogenase (NAD(P)+)
MAAMDRDRVNERYLPNAEFPATLHTVPELHEALDGVRDALVCVPSHAFRAVLQAVSPVIHKDARVAWATKGFEQESGQLPHQVAREVFGNDRNLAVLSGPTFAGEVGAGLPTAMTVAATAPEFATELARRISDSKFRAYTSADIVGVEVGGAVKNALAIGAGLSDGLGFGANARIALISRGLVEMTRLGVALGASSDTFMGLSGMGDLVLTCTDDQSRNRRMGLALAQGRKPEDAAHDIGQVVEGIFAARSVHDVAAANQIEMPICEQVYGILYQRKPVRAAVEALMTRSLKSETELRLTSPAPQDA